MIGEKLWVSKIKAPYRPACHPLVCASGKQGSLPYNVIIIIFVKILCAWRASRCNNGTLTSSLLLSLVTTSPWQLTSMDALGCFLALLFIVCAGKHAQKWFHGIPLFDTFVWELNYNLVPLLYKNRLTSPRSLKNYIFNPCIIKSIC